MSERSDSRGPAAVPLQSLEDDDALLRHRRGRVVLAVVVAALLEGAVVWVMQHRSAARATSAAPRPEAATASAEPPPPLDIDLHRESDEAASRLALTLELASTNEVYQPSEIPVFDDPPPLGRDRLNFSSALGDGDAGRAGVSFDALLPQIATAVPVAAAPEPAAETTPEPDTTPAPVSVPRSRSRPAPSRAPRPSAAAPARVADAAPPLRDPALARPRPSAAPTADEDEMAGGSADLVDLQTRAAAAAAAQPVPLTRVPPRERPLLTPEQEAAAAQAATQADNRRFFSDVTTRLIQANQQALALAVRAGTRTTVDVRFSVDADGRVGEPTVMSADVTPEAAELATRIVATASPLSRPPPALVRGGPLRLTYPVQVYR